MSENIQAKAVSIPECEDAPIRTLNGRVDVTKCFSTAPPKLDFVLPGLLAGTVGGLISPGGFGKSMLTMQIALDVATGSGMSGLPIHGRGPVLLLAGEDPVDAIHTRLNAMGAFLSPEHREAAATSLHVESCIGEGVDLSIDPDLRAIERESIGKRLVVIDTLTRFHSLDENKAADAKYIMGRMEGVAKRTGAAILFLHHVNKAAALGGMADLQQAARGSSVFVDNARWLSFLAGMSPDEADNFGVDQSDRQQWLRFNISKQNYGKRRPDEWYVRDADTGVLISRNIEFTSKLTGKRGKRNGRL